MRSILLAASAIALLAAPASAAPFTMIFEGIAQDDSIDSYYASKGILFSFEAAASVDSDDGGFGNFANEPSSNTVAAMAYGDQFVLNRADGFKNSVSLFYAFDTTAIAIRIFDGIDGTGTELASFFDTRLPVQCAGDPTGAYCNWLQRDIAFSGTARSIRFTGEKDRVLIDNLTLDLVEATAVSEPATLALLGAGLVGLAAVRRRKTA